MRPGTVAVVVFLTVVMTIITTLQFSAPTNTPNSLQRYAQLQLELQFGPLIQFQWNAEESDILGVNIDAQCLDSLSTFQLLGQLKNLQTISLRHGLFSDSDLRPLASLTKLRSVELQSLNFKGSGLAHLTQSKGITTLKLNNNPIWNATESKWLQEFPLLEEIQLAYTNSTDATLATLAHHTELQTVVLDHTAVSSTGIKSLANHNRLIYLSLRGCDLGEQAERTFHEFRTRLPLTLDLSKSSISDKTLESLTSLNIVQLNLSETTVSDRGLEALSGNHHCQQLDLSFTACTSDGLSKTLGTLPLQTLSLRGLELNESVLKTLGHCKALSALSLADTNITDRWLPALQQATALEHLVLYSTPLTGSNLQSLAPLDELSYLDLSNCPLSTNGVEQLQRLSALTSLELIGGNLSDQAIRSLVSTKVTHLNLSNSSIDGTDLKVLATMPELKEIIIRNCSITRNDFEMFQSRNTNCVIYWQEYGL
ncbi:MAG: hypothetical protein VX776_01845, partial [Planctomycetota bacterium]|nr:hypothetical protein [Planctomycetota bacterium]